MNEPDGQADPDPRPWERWGAARRDCAPHRGNVLLLLATVALLLGLSSLCLVVPGWVALPLGWVVEALAQRDLERMTAGTMDPNGREQAERAKELTDLAVAFGVVGGLLCSWPLVLALFQKL